jgi:hypothetical protein
MTFQLAIKNVTSNLFSDKGKKAGWKYIVSQFCAPTFAAEFTQVKVDIFFESKIFCTQILRYLRTLA